MGDPARGGGIYTKIRRASTASGDRGNTTGLNEPGAAYEFYCARTLQAWCFAAVRFSWRCWAGETMASRALVRPEDELETRSRAHLQSAEQKDQLALANVNGARQGSRRAANKPELFWEHSMTAPRQAILGSRTS